MNNLTRIILSAIILIVIIFIVIKLLPDEKKRVINDINNLKNAVEKENKIAILNYIDEDYFDAHNLDYKNLIKVIEEFLNTSDSIDIVISGLKVKIDSVVEHKTFYASCSLGLRVIARYENEKVLVYGGVIQPASVKAYFRKQKDIYRVYSAKY